MTAMDIETIETEMEIDFPENAEQRLMTLEHQIAVGYIQMALALKAIRDEKLFCLRGCPDMKTYSLSYMHMSYQHMKKHLQIADAFTEKSLKKMSKLPMTKLLELSRDTEFAVMVNEEVADIDSDKVVYEDGTFESLDDYLIRTGKADAKKAKQKEVVIEKYKQTQIELEAEIIELRKTIDMLAQQKEIDPAMYTVVSSKKEAVKMIDQSSAMILSEIGSLDNMPRDIVDAEIAGVFQANIAGIQTAVQNLKNNWSAIIFAPEDSELEG